MLLDGLKGSGKLSLLTLLVPNVKPEFNRASIGLSGLRCVRFL